MKPDRDAFVYWFTDFPEVTFTTDEPGVHVEVEPLSGVCPNELSCPARCSYVPPELFDEIPSEERDITGAEIVRSAGSPDVSVTVTGAASIGPE